MAQPPNRLPRWRGFNLLDKFSFRRGIQAFREEDFLLIAELGFDWVRLPMTYMAWTTDDDLFRLDESQLRDIDRAIDFGRQYNLHVNLAFHRAPGHSVNRERAEPFSLWKDQAAVECCAHHWRTFAERYRGIGSERLSFNLWNEPEVTSDLMTRAEHERAARYVTSAIRDVDASRLIIADGLAWGTVPLPELIDLNVAQSCRGYYPIELTHYRAEWNDPGLYPAPRWPKPAEPVSPELAEHYRLHPTGATPLGCDRSRLDWFYQPWVDLVRAGVGVHCGEMGCFNRTPHDVAVAWLTDVLDVLTERGIGWGLWHFRGPFGVLDSERPDVRYEPFRGHRLDRRMLEVLQAH